MKKLLVVGGDRRSLWLSYIAEQNGYPTQACGFDDCEIRLPLKITQHNDLNPADLIVLPFPYQKDGYIPTPLGNPLPFSAIEPLLKEGITVIGGKVDEVLLSLSKERGFNVVDIYRDEAFTMKNAVPSAEGAIFAAMSQGGVTLCGSDCLVMGFGRIGKVLAKQLLGLGARITVAARKPEDRALAAALGYEAVSFDGWHSALSRQRFIFNTAPILLLDRGSLGYVGSNAVIVDVSSAPYGVDFGAARELGIRASIEPGIPGRYSPESAGQILFETVRPFLEAH